MKNVGMSVLVWAALVSPAVSETQSVAETAQEAVEAASQAKLALQIATPRGMVAPFNLSECPEGWAPFVTATGKTAAGRFIVGTSESYPLATVGGSATHTLTPAELPGHTHRYRDVFYSANPGQGQGVPEMPVPQGIGDQGKAANTGNNGIYTIRASEPENRAGEPHENLPPYLSLLYCERE